MKGGQITVLVQSFENLPHGSMTYLLRSAGCGQVVVVDPGSPRTGPVEEHIQGHGLGIEFIILTHEHFDHIGGVERLRHEYKCPVVCSPLCSKAISDPRLNMSRFWTGGDGIVCAPADICCHDGQTFAWAGHEIRIHATPGHTPGSICIAFANCVFTGDTLLPGAKRVTKLPGGDRTQWKESIRSIVSRFDPETVIYPGHGLPFELKDTCVSDL
jgi:glyoxylase-like metal-dependent hydrolase (beta-lactamase superfamily II)